MQKRSPKASLLIELVQWHDQQTWYDIMPELMTVVCVHLALEIYFRSASSIDQLTCYRSITVVEYVCLTRDDRIRALDICSSFFHGVEVYLRD